MSIKDYNTHYTRFTPWFGTWPPEFRGGETDMNNERWLIRHFPHIALGLAFVIGLVFLFGAGYLKGLWREIVTGVGIAFITASIIGIALELAFVTRIAQNVFEVAFGYLLPKEIREETKWIYSMKLLVTDYKHDLEIKRCGNGSDKVFVYETMSRTYKNISNKKLPINPSLGIQEWFHSEARSEIMTYKLTHDCKEYSLEHKDIIIGRAKSQDSPKQSNYILAVKENKLGVKLQPDKTYTWVATVREIKHESDQSISYFGTASMNPYVTVKVPDDMDFDVTFGNRAQAKLQNLGSGHFRLNAMLLPGQAVRITWWTKSNSEKWAQEIDVKYQDTKPNSETI